VRAVAEHDPFEAGLGFAVRRDKGGFIGCDALAQRSAQPPRRRLPCLVIEDPARVVMGGEPVYAGGTPAGYVASAAYGYTIGASIAYAWLAADAAAEGNAMQVEYFGERVPAVVAREPLLDPGMIRLRG
jgi:glycine cleavage system aminomethyltransferase T